MAIRYEWDIEEVDEFDDISNHDFRTKLSDYSCGVFCMINAIEARLVLVKNSGNNVEGLKHRAWAYAAWDKEADEWFLPECFDDGSKVPQKFHDELKAKCEDR